MSHNPTRDNPKLAPLKTWMHILISSVKSDQPDLTNRQMAILMVVYLSPGPHTVRGLASLLHVSKPVVTRALNTLGAFGYIRRQKDMADLRNVFVERTDAGHAFLEAFAERITSSQEQPIEKYGISHSPTLRPAHYE